MAGLCKPLHYGGLLWLYVVSYTIYNLQSPLNPDRFIRIVVKKPYVLSSLFALNEGAMRALWLSKKRKDAKTEGLITAINNEDKRW